MKRDVEVKHGDKWLLVVGLESVKKGQVFRMWDSIDVPVVDKHGKSEFLATSDPYYDNEAREWIVNYDTTQYSDIVN